MTRRTLASEQREAIIQQIARKLNDLDDQTLTSLASLAEEAALNTETITLAGNSISRRRFLVATLASGFMAASAGAVAVWQYGSGRSYELTDELTRLKGLLQLYEKLYDSELERVALAGLAVVGAALDAITAAVKLVKSGAQAIEEALNKFETLAPAVRSSIAWLEGLVSDLTQRVQLLEDAVGRALDQVSPLTQALGVFFTAILKVIPGANTQRIKEVLDRINDIIALIPRLVTEINVKIVTPLRDDWFADGAGKGIKSWLIEPITARLIDPIKALADKWEAVPSQLETELTLPIKAAASKREAFRQEIAEYRARYRV